MSDYKLTVGLEIHAELNTRTKMFCDSLNDPDASRPNTNICPVCMGYPGTLPVINKEAVKSVLRLGLAVNGEIADYTEFDRKNYFYPDIPKGYQISQYKYPLVKGGSIAGVKLTRIHLEEDTASSSHEAQNYSLVDFNRAGVPLVELVTQPVIYDAQTAAMFAREFQLLLNYLNISNANMEKGEMRVEANVSVSKGDVLGTKVEVKNLNSFKAVEKAISFEMQRHIELLERGEELIQETRGWDENRGETFSQRVKEESHDYRYFPDPDLPKLFIKEIKEFNEESLRKTLPELPSEKRDRYARAYGLKDSDVEIYVRDLKWGILLDEVASILKKRDLIKLASNYMTTDLKVRVPASSIAEVVLMFEAKEISSRGAKDILKLIEAEPTINPRKIAEERNLIQKNNTEELKLIAEKVITENAKAVDEYRNGKTASLQFLIGQAMKESKGSANPKILKEIFESFL